MRAVRSAAVTTLEERQTLAEAGKQPADFAD